MSSMKSIFQYSIAKIITAVVAVIVLSACGPSSDEKSVVDNTPPTEGNISPTLFSQDSVHQYRVDEPITISLADKVKLSSDKPLEVHNVELLSDNPNCQIVATSEMTISLAPQVSPGICQLQYKVKTKEPSPMTYQSERMVAQVIVTESPIRMANTTTFSSPLSAAALPPISVTVNDTSTVQTINLKSQLATLYPTDADNKSYILSSTILVLGKGTAVKSSDSAITYTPDSNDEGGVTRILYSLTDDFDDDGNGDFKVGSVDISVSEQTVNQAPVANHFNWNNNGTKIALGKKYTIDVTNIIDGNCTVENNDGNTATNSCISDPDTSDELQLVGIFAYDAIVAPTSLTALDSTKFDVTFNRTGIHDITYYISDHAGGYAIGIMRVDIPHNIAPIFNGPKIIDVNADSSVNVTGLGSIITDPEGKNIEIVSITSPSEGIITNINKTALTFTYTPLTKTIGLIPVKVTFTDGELTTVGDIIFIVEQINSISLASDRNVTTPLNTPKVINIEDYIVGLTTAEIVTITQVSGSQLGTTVISASNPHLVTYTPNNNVYGVDDFAFTIKTNLGNIESGDISMIIGNPPPLVISDINATENKNTDVITASVDCANCDVNQYQYSWAIKGTIVSTEKSFTISQDQRSYDVLLTVFAKDVFSQSDHMQKGFNFFELSVGTFDTPADSCQAIYDEYNSPDSLVVDDGEYWINGISGKYKTQCDMVTRSQATEQSKQHSGGYTLIWSYSEKTNLERFDSSRTKQFSQRNKNVAFSDNLPRGVVSTESGTVNYNDFRVSQSEMTRLGTRVTRFGYTSDPSVETIDADPDNTVQDWIIESTGPIRFVVSPYDDLNGNQLLGKYKGYSYKMDANRNVTIGSDVIGRAGFYEGGYGWHVDHNDPWAAEKISINNNFGFWGQNSHEGSDLFGTCTNPTMISEDGYTALGCNGDDDNAMTYHNSINSGEGYVMQWWFK